MMQRVPRYPPPHARLIRLDEGPPMYRMLGYADRSNVHWDLTDPAPMGYCGPFSLPRMPPNQTMPVGPGRFGLPSHPLAYTTTYWDARAFTCDHTVKRAAKLREYVDKELPVRPEAEIFPEMAVPGTGMLSKFRNSGYILTSNLPPPGLNDEWL